MDLATVLQGYPYAAPYQQNEANVQATGPGWTYDIRVDAATVGTFFCMSETANNTDVGFLSMNLRADPFWMSGPFNIGATYSGICTRFKWFKIKRVEYHIRPTWNMNIGSDPAPDLIVVRDAASVPGDPPAINASETAWLTLTQNSDIVKYERSWRRPIQIGYMPYTLAVDSATGVGVIGTQRTYPWYPVPGASPTSSNNPYHWPGYFIMMRFPSSGDGATSSYSWTISYKLYVLAVDYSASMQI